MKLKGKPESLPNPLSGVRYCCQNAYRKQRYWPPAILSVLQVHQSNIQIVRKSNELTEIWQQNEEPR